MSGYERNNIAEMRAGQNRHEPMVSSETWRDVDGKHAHLSASQRAAVEQIVSSQDKIVGLEGVAGAGKTTSLACCPESRPLKTKTATSRWKCVTMFLTYSCQTACNGKKRRA
jgi:predicted ribonuclease YlaK